MAEFQHKRKRKLSTDTISNSSDEVVASSQADSDVEIVEKSPKIRHVDLLTDSNHSSLEIVSNSSSCDDNSPDIQIVDVQHSKVRAEHSAPEVFSREELVLEEAQTSNGPVNEDSDVEIISNGKEVHSNISESLDSVVSLKSLGSDTLASSIEFVQPDLRIKLDEIYLQNSNSNAECGILGMHNNRSTKDQMNIEEKLLALEREIIELRAENEVLRFKGCLCDKQNIVASIQSEQKRIATISFSTIEDYNSYKNEFLTVLTLKFDVRERVSDLLIEIFEDDIDISDWVIVDEAQVEKQKPKRKYKLRKKKKNRVKVDADLFMLDTTPCLQTKSSMQYESKFSVALGNANNEEQQKTSISTSICFNCGESHVLRDCPYPKNFGKIHAARQKYKGNQSNKSIRYHVEEEQKFSQFKAGKISEQLRHALGLRDDQLPMHIYKMRQLGYPPGWFEELQPVENSQLLLFDFEGKNDFKKKIEASDVDLDKIVEYAGFNVPMESGIKDEFRYHGCPQYSKECSKHKMFEYARKMSQKTKDNVESFDMEIEDQTSPKDKPHISPTHPPGCSSPTLNELEKAKKKLLSELIDANDDSISNSTSVQDESNNTKDFSFVTVDVTGGSDILNESNIVNQPCTPVRNVSLVKLTSFGTPLLTPVSPYCKLPRPENFQQDVSDVINFENLPNSTGKYEQMVGVLEKVRKQLKSISSL